MEKFNLLLPKGGKGGCKPAFLRKVYHISILNWLRFSGGQIGETPSRDQSTTGKLAKNNTNQLNFLKKNNSNN